MIVPKGFLPSEDQGRFQISVEGHSGHRLRGDGAPPAGGGRHRRARIPTSSASAATSAAAAAAAAAARSNQGRMGVDLKPRAERTRSVDQIMAELRPKLAQVPGVRVFMVNQPPINLGGSGARAALSVHAAGHRHGRALSVGAAARRGDAGRSRASKTSTATCG